MKKIEDMLENIKVPQIDDKYQFNAIRSQMLQRFFSSQRTYILRYRWAASVAAVMFIILAATFLMPQLATDINTLVFGKTREEPVVVENTPRSKGILLEDGQLTNSETGSIIDDEKTYLIRQYHTPRSGKVMIVSEYQKQPQNSKIRQVSASCY